MKSLLQIVILAVLLSAGTAQARLNPSKEQSPAELVAKLLPTDLESAKQWLCPDYPAKPCDETDIDTVKKNMMRRAIKELTGVLQGGAATGDHHRPSVKPQGESGLPWWRFIPTYEGKLRPTATGGANMLPTFACPCFGAVTAQVNPELAYGQFANVTITATEQAPRGITTPCMQRFFMTVGAKSEHLQFEFSATKTIFFNTSTWDNFTHYDYQRNGIRLYVFNDTHWEQLEDILQTLLLFLPDLTGKEDPVSMANNMAYMNQFSQIQPFVVDRPTVANGGTAPNSGVVTLDETTIKNGDMLFEADMDGMGPTIAFPTGTTANHAAIFLRNPDWFDELNVCESAAKGVVCTPYAAWIKATAKAGGAVVYMPLAANISASFDNGKAWAWVKGNVGLRYGYNNFFFGWIDTKEANYPCMPPDWKRCMVWEHVEYVLLLLESLVPSMASEYVGQAFNHRLNTTGLSMSELFRVADSKGLERAGIMAMPELDSYTYKTTKNGSPITGPSMVCSVLACQALRQGGAFASSNQGDFQCAEQTPFDVASMEIFDSTKFGTGRPAACQTADPTNDLCQLTGPFTFHLNYGKNSRVPYTNMGNSCESQNPLYKRSPGC